MNRILLTLTLLISVAVSAQRTAKSVAATKMSKPSTGLKTAISPETTNWEEKEAYVNGFARVLSNNQFSFINNSGKLICPVQFEDARNFVNKLAAVKKDAKWGFINEDGMLVIPCRYEIVYDFKENISPVYTDKKWVLIDTKGTIVGNPEISACYGFDNGKARVEKDGRNGIMNLAGEISFTGEIPSPFITRTFQAPVNNAATQCPDNIDFENGNFSNWNCFIGSVDSSGSTNVITVSPSAPIASRHRIIPRVLPSAIDGYGLFPTNPPDGSNFAVKLGNTRIGAEAERIQYIIRIPANDSNFSIRYDYAVVFQDPGHTPWTQPRFTAKLFDSTANAYIDCASFEYIATSNLPGFAVSTIDTSVIYKPWSSVFISLRGHAGETLYLEFTTADCVRRGHWGYAYVDVESTCSHSVDMNYDCATGIANLDGPPGFQTYNWWNQDYTSILATGQNIILNPAPAANSIINLEMIPFNDFGCRDSMPVTITNTFTPHFNVSERVGICAPHSFTFYNADLPSLSAIWDFGDGTPVSTGDTVTHVYTLPGTYMVTLTVTLPSGCNGTFQDVVKVIQPSGTFNYTGGNFCNSAIINFTSTSTNVDSLSWNFGDGTGVTTTPGTISHTYTLPGIYIPTLTLISNHGCRIILPGTDTVKIENLLAGFKADQQRNCGSTLVNFTDTSHAATGISSYAWDFGDGNAGTGSTISHVYTTAGTYAVQLIITGAAGCADTIVQQINIVINNIPVASITGPSSECFHVPVTFTGSVISGDPVGSMDWSSSDGSTGSGNSFTVNYSLPGTYTVQLIAGTVNGCYDTTTQQITIKPVPDVAQPNNLWICNGATVGAVIFTGSVSGTIYSWTNDDPSIGLPASGNGDIPSFTAINSTILTATATITVTPIANGCPGTPVTFTITVYPTPVIIQPADQVVCNRGITDPVLFNNFAAVASGTFSWTNDMPSIGLAANGTGDIPSFTAINNSDVPVTATIIISVANNGCQGTPTTFRITVNPTPDVIQPANQTFCNAVSTGVVHFTGSVINTNYTWTNDQVSIGLPANGADSIPSFNSINFSNAPVIAHIVVTPSANGCQGTPSTFSFIINPIPDVDQPINQSVCTGNPTSIVNFTGSVYGTSFDWTNDVPSIGLPATGTGNILSFNPNNSSNANLIATLTVTPTANSCVGTPKFFTITIFPTPGMIQPLNQFQCNGETTFPMTFASPVAGTTFTWANSMPSIGLPASGTGNVPSFTTNNPTNATVTAAITVTPSTGDCPGISKIFYITVDPTPDMAQPANQTVCNREIVNGTAFVGTVAGTSYTWINNNTAIGLAANGTGDISSFTATNNTYFPITAVVQVTGSANSCGSAVKVFTITVNPSPAVDAPSDQVVCNGIATTAIPLTGPVSGTSFSWKNDRPSIGLPAIGNGDIPSFIAVNNTNAPVIANIIILGTSNNCGEVLDTLTITVNPSAPVQATDNSNICLGNAVTLSAHGAVQYSWSPAIGLSCTTCTNPTVTPTESIVYTVTGISNLGCTGMDSVKLMVRMPFDMLIPPNDTMCIGGSRSLRAMNAATYLWSPPTGLDHVDISNPTATPTTTTTYQVIGYDGYHCFTDTGYVTIAVGPKPTVNIGADHTMMNGTAMTFHPVVQNGPIVRYTWTPAAELSCSDCPNPSAIIKNNTMYTVTVENSFGCSAVDSIFISAFCTKAEVFIPNAFTPDGDGLNDVLVVRGTGISVKCFRVFNRWGELVFERKNFGANDVKNGWDGKIRGVAATPDVYVYTAEVMCDNGAVYTYKGNTTILK